MLFIGILIGVVAGFVIAALISLKRINEAEARAESGPLCSMCQADEALQACRADCKALQEQVSTLKRSRAQLLGHNARLMNGFLYPRKGA